MAVLFDAACHWVILTHHSGNIPHAHHLACGCIAIDNLIGYLLLTILHSLDMDGYLLVGVADATAHSGDALGLQTTEKHLLSDAIGLQALTVDIERDLLLLLAEEFHVSDRRDAAQTVAQVVAILFQFAVAALVALNSDEKCRGVAEVIVHHDGEHA